MNKKKIALMDRFHPTKFTEGDNFIGYAKGFLEKNCEIFQLDPYKIDFANKKTKAYSLILTKGRKFSKSNSTKEIYLENFDAIMDLSDIVDLNFAQQLSKIKTIHINDPIATYKSADKRTYVKRYPELIPESLVSSNINELERNLMDKFNGQMILKNPFGCCGNDIEKITQKTQNRKEIFLTMTQNGTLPIVAQEFVELAYEGSKRIAILGNPKNPESYKIIHFYKRQPKQGEWKDNLSQGGKVVEIPSLRKDEIKLCLEVAKKSGLYTMGLDIMDNINKEGKRIPQLIETNSVLALAFGRYPEKLKIVTNFITGELLE
jgi:glutathione synthase/RimK-type ligase-like ATP-grasp enzyme